MPLPLPLLLRITADTAADTDLLGRFVATREERAFAELVARHGPLVWGVCRRVLRHEQDAEDAFQTVFVALARYAGRLRGGAALPAWLHRTAVREARAAARRRTRRVVREQHAARQEAVLTPEPADWRMVFDEELNRLPTDCRAAMVLCDIQGRTHAAAARMLGCPVGSISWRLARARALLRERLLRRGLTPAIGGLALAVPAAVAGAAVAAGLRVGVALPWVKAWLAAGVLLLALVGTGAGLAWPRGEELLPRARHETPPPALDRLGEPLPLGAIARLGSSRYRVANVWNMALVDDQTLLTAASGGLLSYFDITSGRTVRRESVPWRDSRIVSLSRDGSAVAVEAGGFGCAVRVHVWDVRARRERFKLEYPPHTSVMMQFSPDSRVLSILDADPPSYPQKNRLRFYDSSTGQELPAPPANRRFQNVAFNSDGRRFYSLSREALECWELATARRVWAIAGDFAERNLSVSADGQRAVVGVSSMDVEGVEYEPHCYDLTLGQADPSAKLPKHARGTSYAFEREGHSLIMVSGPKGVVS